MTITFVDDDWTADDWDPSLPLPGEIREMNEEARRERKAFIDAGNQASEREAAALRAARR